MIGEKIKKARKALKLTQKDLAEKIGVSAIAISRYEKNTRIPNTDILFKICNALKISPLSFIDWSKVEATSLEDEPITKILENIGFDIYERFDSEQERPEPYIEIVNSFKDKVYNISLSDYQKLKAETADYIEFKLQKYSNNFSANQPRPTATDNKPTDQ